MTHEIRTPINGVIGTASLLEITEMTDEQRGYVETITSSADILLSLVHNILDISKIEKGKLELDLVPLQFAVHMAKACSIMQARAEDKDIGFVVDISPELDSWYSADPTRLNQIMLNFLSNAIKFTHGGEVKCRVRKVESYTTSVEGISQIVDVALIEIIDSGIGVADPSRLFCEFVQASRSITQTYGGTGLGLSITKKLVELMGGTVGMTSELGKGTVCWAKIPLVRTTKPILVGKYGDHAYHCRKTTKSGESETSVDSKTRQPRILVVEDNKVNMKMVRRMLETLDYSDVSVAVDGREAVTAYTEAWQSGNRFNVILMDCLMPVMNGWDATEAIR